MRARVLLAFALLSPGCNAVFGLDERTTECSVDGDCGANTECQTNRCAEGLCARDNAPPGTACSEHPEGQCNGSGVCNAASCSDQVRNQDESDIDCGGVCGPCGGGQACAAPEDCESGFCPADDGVCCDTACDAQCTACSGDKTGAASGTCSAIAQNTDPDGDCLGNAETCEVAGCNGQASGPGCNRMEVGEVCRADADPPEGGCDKPEVCDATGACPADIGSNLLCEPELNEKSTNCAADCGIELIASGASTSCGVLADGSTWCWGRAVGSDLPRQVDVGVAGKPKELVMGGDTACVIRADDTVACWLDADFGQVGDGSTEYRQVVANGVVKSNGSPQTAVSISMGEYHVCAAQSNKTVWCWGLNNAGQLGNASPAECNPAKSGFPCSSVAVQVAGIANADRVFLGALHSCAILADQTVRCWGLNDAGQIGCSPAPGPGVATASPVQVAGLTNVVDGSGGLSSSCVATSAGTVRCFGDNAVGQLGNGTTNASCSSVVAQLSGASSVRGGWGDGDYHCARLNSGAVECWGANGWEQLGIALQNSDPNPLPVAVLEYESNNMSPLMPLSGAQQLSCGGRSCFIIKDDGTARAWGANEFFQLGVIQSFAASAATGLDFL